MLTATRRVEIMPCIQWRRGRLVKAVSVTIMRGSERRSDNFFPPTLELRCNSQHRFTLRLYVSTVSPNSHPVSTCQQSAPIHTPSLRVNSQHHFTPRLYVSTVSTTSHPISTCQQSAPLHTPSLRVNSQHHFTPRLYVSTASNTSHPVST